MSDDRPNQPVDRWGPSLETRLRLLASQKLLLFEVDRLGRWSFLSESWKSLTGFAARQATGLPAAQAFHPADQGLARSLFEPGGGEARQGEIRLIHADGGQRWVAIYAQPAPAGVVGTMLAIDARRLTDETLRRSIATNRALLSAMPDTLLRISRDGLLTDFHHPQGSTLPLQPVDLLGQPIESLLGPPAAGLVRRAVAAALQGAGMQLVETVLQVGERELAVELRITMAGEHEALAIVRDITDRQMAERELARAAQMKEGFVASMSHELRTPLTSILGLVEAILEDQPGGLSERQVGHLRMIVESSERLLEQINSILEISRIDGGLIQIEAEPTLVAEVCAASLNAVRQSAARRQIQLREPVVAPGLTILADPRRLKQILVRLLENAVKFTPPGGAVGLEVQADRAEELVIVVSDSGIGIAADQTERIFEPFVQLQSGLDRPYSGSGLGLALARSLALLHGGWLEVETQPGRGSRFVLRLPRGREAGREAGRAAGAARRILVVDDNPASGAMVADYLEAIGYLVSVALSGPEALRQADQRAPDLVLMDVQMPGMDGLETTRRMRAQAGGAAAPVIIALTALAMPGDRERCLAAGMNDYLSKPLRLAEIAARVALWLGPRPTP